MSSFLDGPTVPPSEWAGASRTTDQVDRDVFNVDHDHSKASLSVQLVQYMLCRFVSLFSWHTARFKLTVLNKVWLA